jgi:hypothetical protein
MPTLMRIGAARVVVYLNDHRPAHVHVIGSGHLAVFDLNCPDGPPVLREVRGYSRVEASRFKEDLRAHLQALCDRWRAIHGAWR